MHEGRALKSRGLLTLAELSLSVVIAPLLFPGGILHCLPNPFFVFINSIFGLQIWD